MFTSAGKLTASLQKWKKIRLISYLMLPNSRDQGGKKKKKNLLMHFLTFSLLTSGCWHIEYYIVSCAEQELVCWVSINKVKCINLFCCWWMQLKKGSTTMWGGLRRMFRTLWFKGLGGDKSKWWMDWSFLFKKDSRFQQQNKKNNLKCLLCGCHKKDAIILTSTTTEVFFGVCSVLNECMYLKSHLFPGVNSS